MKTRRQEEDERSGEKNVKVGDNAGIRGLCRFGLLAEVAVQRRLLERTNYAYVS